MESMASVSSALLLLLTAIQVFASYGPHRIYQPDPKLASVFEKLLGEGGEATKAQFLAAQTNLIERLSQAEWAEAIALAKSMNEEPPTWDKFRELVREGVDRTFYVKSLLARG